MDEHISMPTFSLARLTALAKRTALARLTALVERTALAKIAALATLTGLVATVVLGGRVPLGAQAGAADGVPALSGGAPDTVPTATERGRTLTRAFYRGALERVTSHMTDAMLAAIGGADGLAAFRDQVIEQLGAEGEVVAEEVRSLPAQHVQYRRLARFERAPGPVEVVWTLDVDRRVTGFTIRPADAPAEAPSRYLDYETRTELRLPFEGAWTVLWGGRTVDRNYHAAHVDQRFAYDLAVVVDGSTHTGDGTSNDDYHCFGRVVLAPAAGRVVEALDGIADNVPGHMNPEHPAGNHVVIDHGHDEHSFLAHLRQGSVGVRAGDSVAAGDTLGLCGNSGRSSEPHLHYHLQNTPVLGRGEGLPARFTDYEADGERVELGEPVRGERVRPAESNGRFVRSAFLRPVQDHVRALEGDEPSADHAVELGANLGDLLSVSTPSTTIGRSMESRRMRSVWTLALAPKPAMPRSTVAPARPRSRNIAISASWSGLPA